MRSLSRFVRWTRKFRLSTLSLLRAGSSDRWRPFLTIDGFRITLGIGVIHFTSHRIPLQWQVSRAYTSPEFSVAIELNPLHWRVKRSHVYYDGPHDMLDILFLQFYWDVFWCDRCHAGK